jgi:hypothetical protein
MYCEADCIASAKQAYLLLIYCFVELEGNERPIYTPLLEDKDYVTSDFLGKF